MLSMANHLLLQFVSIFLFGISPSYCVIYDDDYGLRHRQSHQDEVLLVDLKQNYPEMNWGDNDNDNDDDSMIDPSPNKSEQHDDPRKNIFSYIREKKDAETSSLSPSPETIPASSEPTIPSPHPYIVIHGSSQASTRTNEDPERPIRIHNVTLDNEEDVYILYLNGNIETEKRAVERDHYLSKKEYEIALALTISATVILVCALVIIVSDWREKKSTSVMKMEQHVIDQHISDDASSQKSTTIREWCVEEEEEEEVSCCSSETFSNEDDQYWIQAMMKELANYNPSKNEHPPNMLPPLDSGSEHDEHNRETFQGQIPKSAMVIPEENEMGYGTEVVEFDSTQMEKVSTSDELDKKDPQALLRKTMKRLLRIAKDSFDDSNCSEWSSLTEDSHVSALGALFEQKCGTIDLFSDEQVEKEGSTLASTDIESNFTDSHDGGNSRDVDALVNITDLAHSDIESNGKSLVGSCANSDSCMQRELFFPVTSTDNLTDLGIDVQDASSKDTYPLVSKVCSSSELVGRIIPGDLIIGVNGQNTIGVSAAHILDGVFHENDNDVGGQRRNICIVRLKLLRKRQIFDEEQFGMLEGRVEI